jgi:hypothetical protein
VNIHDQNNLGRAQAVLDRITQLYTCQPSDGECAIVLAILVGAFTLSDAQRAERDRVK